MSTQFTENQRTAYKRLEHAAARVILRNEQRKAGHFATAWKHTQAACENLQQARDLLVRERGADFETRADLGAAFSALAPAPLAHVLSLYLMAYECRLFPEQEEAAHE